MPARAIDLTGYGLPYWLDIERPRYPALAGDVRADVAIVGAGIAGLKLADYASAHGLECVVLEARQVGEGASSRNQGCIVTGLPVSYGALAARVSRGVARRLVALSYHNQELLEEQMARHGIACDYEVLGETLLARGDRGDPEPALASLRRDAALMAEDGFAADYLDAAAARAVTGNPLFAGGIRFRRDAQFHSGRFVVGLGAAVTRSPRVRIFERSPVAALESTGSGDAHLLRTPRGTVSADHLCVATNALVPQLLPALTGTLRAERGQVLVTAPGSERPCRGCFAAGTAWWRDVRDADGRYRLLFGGGRSRDEPDSLFPQYAAGGHRNRRIGTAGFRPTLAHQRRLHAHLAEVFPHLADAPVTHRWGGLQSFTFDGLPVIGVFDPERRIHGMAGFSGMGNSYSNVGAAYLAARIAGAGDGLPPQFAETLELMLAPARTGARWPGPEPTRLRSQPAVRRSETAVSGRTSARSVT